MTTEQSEPISFKNFSNSVLPWIVLAGALILYIATLNHFVTFSSLSFVAKVSGWDWQKPVAAPLYYLLTLPVRWLPAAWHPIALNLFSAICATLTLGLLARSVALLPQDRTKEQRSREHDEFSLLSIRWAWIPVVAAVLLCGFQFTFWENATVASGEILDLLIFAYVIRCLLEFRLTENETWLSKFAFVYGLGMTNNWAMLGYFPLFLIALVWIRGIAFFNWRFIGRMAAFGFAGLLLYLLLPAVGTFSDSGLSFWEILKINLGHQKNLTLGNPFIGGLKFDFLTMALTSLLPILLVGTRWTADYADVSPMGTLLSNLMFRVLHLALLVFCVWVFFDYKFSPRILGHGLFAFLTLYYLSAISVGYLCGYVLLVFGSEVQRGWGKSRSSLRYFNTALAVLTGIGALAMPLWLSYRTLPAIRELNGPAVKNFARQMASTLPKNAVLLSDDSLRLNLVQAFQAVEGQGIDQLFLNTRFLPSPRYQQYLRGHYPSAKNAFVNLPASDERISSLPLIGVLEGLRQSRPIYYLHPSFGYYFEQYYPRQHGLVYELKPYHADDLLVPKLEESEIDENEKFWSQISAPALKALTDLAANVQDASILCSFYSSALNAWGVELQRNNQLKLAEEKFYVAWKLDPNNTVAQINGRYNVNLQQGKALPIEADEALLKQLTYLRGLVGAIGYFGPVDEPGACLALGRIFQNGNNLRQAAQQYTRVTQLMPEDPVGRLSLARVLVDLHQPERVLKEVGDVRTQNKNDLGPYEFELLDLQARALLLKGDFAAAEALMMEALEQDLKDETRHRLVFQFYLNAAQLAKGPQAEERYRKALGILDQLLVIHPDSVYLLNKSAVLNQIGKTDEAISTLNTILESEPGNLVALMNRAIYLLQAGRLDAAKADYLALEKLTSTELPRVYYGLAQIAERSKDTAGAIKYYKAYLKSASDSAEFRQVTQRLKELQGGKKV